jgi:DTW domain-containing protein YfiP
LPRLSLTDIETGSYRIRKAHREGQLSTLEASVLALSRWDDAVYRFLLSAFSGLMQDYEDNLLAQKTKKP